MGTALLLKEGGTRGKVIVGVAAVLNIGVLCVAFALVSKSLDERELNRPIPSEFQSRLPDGKIRSLSFLGLCQGGGRGGAIQGKEGIKFCSVA